MKGFVYFFRHKTLKPVKIGYTTSDTIDNRFIQFKTYAPYGAEIIRIIKTDEAKRVETELHKRFAEYRLNGEWFDITDDMVNSAYIKYSIDNNDIITTINLYIGRSGFNYKRLRHILEASCNKTTISSIDEELLQLITEMKSLTNATNIKVVVKDISTLIDDKYTKGDIRNFLKRNSLNGLPEKQHRYIDYRGFRAIGRPFII